MLWYIYTALYILLLYKFCSDSAQTLLLISWTYYSNTVTYCSDTIVLNTYYSNTIVLHYLGDYYYMSCSDYICLCYFIMILIIYIICSINDKYFIRLLWQFFFSQLFWIKKVLNYFCFDILRVWESLKQFWSDILWNFMINPDW